MCQLVQNKVIRGQLRNRTPEKKPTVEPLVRTRHNSFQKAGEMCYPLQYLNYQARELSSVHGVCITGYSKGGSFISLRMFSTSSGLLAASETLINREDL